MLLLPLQKLPTNYNVFYEKYNVVQYTLVLFIVNKKLKTSVEQYEMYLHFKSCCHANEDTAFEELCIQLNRGKNDRTPANWKRVI